MNQDTTPSARDRANARQDRRINITGTAASVSATAALVAAISSIFAAFQSYNISQRIAREQVFGRQVEACSALGTLSSELQGASRMALRGMAMSSIPATPAETAEVTRLFAAREQVGVRLTGVLATTDIVFGDLLDSAELERIVRIEVEYLNAQIGMADDNTYAPAEMIRLRDIQYRQAEALNAQRNRCRDYLRGVVRGAGEVR